MSQTSNPSFSPGQVPCSYHPDVMTGLRCSRCGKPICPKCAVRTPVGLRCPDCAGVRGLPTYRTGSANLMKAGAAGLAVALGTALVWRFFPEWQFYLCLVLGFGVVETIARLTGNKRGADLQLLAIGIITVGFVVSRALLAQRFGISLGEINALDDRVSDPAMRDAFGRFSMPVSDALQLRFVPDIVYLAMAYAIGWVRFR